MMQQVPKFMAGASLALALAAAGTAQAGTWATITIDDDYSDWVGVPVVDSDPADNVGGVDFFEVQIANDADYLYVRNTYHTANAISTFMGIDIDEDTATGFNIFGLDLIGQDAGWQNDYPFTSGDDVFNDGYGMSGDFFGIGAGLLAPYGDFVTREMAIPLNVTLNEDGSPLFPDDTIRILFWTDSAGAAGGDVSAVIDYQLAVPEPASLALLGLGGLAMLRRR